MNWFKELTSGKLEYKTTGDLQKDRELEENYIKAFNDAIEIANSTDKGRILINKWKNISHKPTMVEAELVREYNKSNPNNGVEKKKWNTRYDPASNKIYWSPRISLILTNINRTEIISFTSPASILLHEAFHLTDEKLLTHLMMNHPLYRDEAEHYAVTHTNEIRRELGETERFYYISNKGQRETKDSAGASNAFYNDNGNRVEVKINIITEESSSNVRIRKTTIDRHFFDRNLVEIKTIRFVGEKDYNNNLIKTFEKVLEPNVGQVIDEDYISGVKKNNYTEI